MLEWERVHSENRPWPKRTDLEFLMTELPGQKDWTGDLRKLSGAAAD
jgi:hypothetical protein